MGERCDEHISLTPKAFRRVLLSSFLFLGPDSLPHLTLFIRQRTTDRHPTSSKRYDDAVIVRNSRLPGGARSQIAWSRGGSKPSPSCSWLRPSPTSHLIGPSDTSTSPPHAPGHPYSSTTQYITSRDGWTSLASSYRPRPQSIPPVSTRPSTLAAYSTLCSRPDTSSLHPG